MIKLYLSKKKAIKINPDYATAHNNLGLAYGEKGMTDEEISVYKKSLVNKDKQLNELLNQ